MKVIGITGGVGSGKSTVVRWIEEEYPVRTLLADEIGHLAFNPESDSYQKIIDCFGTGICDERGQIDRGALAEIVFEDAKKRECLNAIIHPFVIAKIKEEIRWCRQRDITMLLESAILIESGCRELCDELWYVWASAAVRKERLKRDRQYSDAKIDAIMQNQLSEDDFREAADVVIRNDGDREQTMQMVRAVL